MGHFNLPHLETRHLLSKVSFSFRWHAAVPVLFLALASSLCAQVPTRIVSVPDNSTFVRIPGTVHPFVGSATTIGRAPAGLPMERMLLQLSSSPGAGDRSPAISRGAAG